MGMMTSSSGRNGDYTVGPPPHLTKKERRLFKALASANKGLRVTSSIQPEEEMLRYVAEAGACSMRGDRRDNEDAFELVVQNPTQRNGPSPIFFGVFDGHAGTDCAQFLTRELPQRLFAAVCSSPDSAANYKGQNVEERVQAACFDADKVYLYSRIEAIGATELPAEGSTATFCVLQPPEDDGTNKFCATVGHVGDSYLLHIRGQEVLFCTNPHTPQDPLEKERIVRCGGTVTLKRVDGDLAISRAFGDASFKGCVPQQRRVQNSDGDPAAAAAREDADELVVPSSTPAVDELANQKVVALAEVHQLSCEEGDLLVLVSDGMFESDSFQAENLAELLHNTMKSSTSPPSPPMANAEAGQPSVPVPATTGCDLMKLADDCCMHAFEAHSHDNITCLVVKVGLTTGGPIEEEDYINVTKGEVMNTKTEMPPPRTEGQIRVVLRTGECSFIQPFSTTAQIGATVSAAPNSNTDDDNGAKEQQHQTNEEKEKEEKSTTACTAVAEEFERFREGIAECLRQQLKARQIYWLKGADSTSTKKKPTTTPTVTVRAALQGSASPGKKDSPPEQHPSPSSITTPTTERNPDCTLTLFSLDDGTETTLSEQDGFQKLLEYVQPTGTAPPNITTVSCASIQLFAELSESFLRSES